MSRIEPRALTPIEQKLLMNTLAEKSSRDRLIILLLLMLGLTVKEICYLKKNDIMVKKGQYILLVRESDIARRFHINEKLKKELQDYLFSKRDRCMSKEGYLFSGRKGRLSERAIYHIIKKCGLETGLNFNLSPYILRYTYFENNIKKYNVR